jgi:SAM-dependent methyltransferase
MEKWFESDNLFNSLFPEPIQLVAQKHWTPLEVAKKAAQFLAVSAKEKVLDIGSGSGKFCLIAAHFYPEVQFVGVEQRKDLVELSNKLAAKLELKNAQFIHENISNLDFSKYDHFYFYNSFYENFEGTQKIDNKVPYSEKLYDYYNLCLYKQFNKKPTGTRIASYHSLGNEIPPGYEVMQTDFENYLQYWIKT